MTIREMNKQDFNFLLEVVDDWWGSQVRHMLHPMLLYQFGDTAFVAEDKGQVVGFLAGFISQKDPLEAYIHLAAVDPKQRLTGTARTLYEHFISEVLSRGCDRLKAITLPENTGSIAFHRKMGFSLVEQGTMQINGVPAIGGYSGPGNHRVVFEKIIGE